MSLLKTREATQLQSQYGPGKLCPAAVWLHPFTSQEAAPEGSTSSVASQAAAQGTPSEPHTMTRLLMGSATPNQRSLKELSLQLMTGFHRAWRKMKRALTSRNNQLITNSNLGPGEGVKEEEGEVVCPEQHSASPGGHQAQQHALTEGFQQDSMWHHGHAQLAPPVNRKQCVMGGLKH
ncbi:hypothetical protein E2C01_017667 [Portunus trituberculatus]|uniref:Uncharacterized protein n=1 Tax=Portunus trituberculatus TaxID=210409 RepID=A0A5B7DSK3_PORTR|nr:hypothetical protein [Portunus trituberculatus]